MIGKSEEKLRPKSIFMRRVLARYVVWVTLAGYLLVFALFGLLIAAIFVKAGDDILSLEGEVLLRADVLRAERSAWVRALADASTTVSAGSETLIVLEESPARVARASLLNRLKQERRFAQDQGEDGLAQRIAEMIAGAEEDGDGLSAQRKILASLDGNWFPMVGVGDVVTSGSVLGIVFQLEGTDVAIDVNHPSVSQRGKKLKPDQPAEIQFKADGVDIKLSGEMVRGGKTEPRLRVTSITSDDLDKILQFLQNHPDADMSFTEAIIPVTIGIKSWASLIWK